MEPELTLEFLRDELGFKEIGKWELIGDKIFPNITDNNVPNDQCAVYAFVVRQKIMYIGKATYAGYKSRFDRYVNIGNTKFTNFRCNQKIREAIASKDDVLIYVHLADTYPCGKSGIIKINLAESLENKLVKILKHQDEAKKDYSWNWTENQLKKF
ncbi:MAG: hypothetical protein KGP29_06990 [Proteobacteria bacterium]|nr:hypothetical protein [Pseudomonadota bacterium]